MMSFTFRDSGPPHPLASSVVIGARPVIVIFKQTQRSKVGMPCRTTLREQKTSHPASGHHDVSDVCDHCPLRRVTRVPGPIPRRSHCLAAAGPHRRARSKVAIGEVISQKERIHLSCTLSNRHEPTEDTEAMPLIQDESLEAWVPEG